MEKGKKDQVFAHYFDCTVDFLYQRSREALLKAMNGEEPGKNLILVGQLTTIIRIKEAQQLVAEATAKGSE
jgi:hypothetical protein